MSAGTVKKARPNQLRWITLRHQGSGAEKRVEYLAMMGRPLRAQIFWPGAGDYLVVPRSGRLCGEKRNADTRWQWQVVPEDRPFLNQEWRLARARAALPVHGGLMSAQR
jgi:hypothetical protein